MTREVPDWAKKISPFVDRHLSETEKERLQTHYDGAAWERLFADARSLLGTDPAAPPARALAIRWKELTATVTGGNKDIKEKLANIQRDALADPQTAQTFPVSPDVLEFIRAAVAKLDLQQH